jgi:anti-sigma-K factor RskA
MSQEAPNPQQRQSEAQLGHSDAQLERRLDALFAQYRDACPPVEPSANFTPNLWARIQAQQESRRGWMWHLGAYAKRMAVATAAACMLLVGIRVGTAWNAESLLSRSYVDVLQDSAATEDYAYVPVLDQGGRFE